MYQVSARSSGARAIAAIFLLASSLLGCGGGNTSAQAVDGQQQKLDKSNATLRTSQFGQGTVVSQTATLNCQGQACTAVVKTGSTNVITALAATGWAFDHWTGCDSVTENKCTVSIDSDRSVQPFFNRTAAPTVSSDVVVLTDSTMAGFLGVEGAVYKFANSASQIATLKAGQIMISGQGNGFARRISNVIALTGSNYLVDTRPASLSEIITDGVIMGGTGITQAVVQGVQTGPGVHISAAHPQAAAATTVELDIPFDNGSHITGSIDIAWNPEVAFDFGLFDGLREAKLIINPTITPHITVSYNGFDIDKEKIFDLGIFKLTPIYIQVGPVPIIIVPTVSGYAKFEATGAVKVDLVSTFSLSGSYGAHYMKGVGWDGLNSSLGSGSFSPSAALEVDTKFGVGAYAAFAIYDVLGPAIQVGPYVHAVGAYDPTGLKPCSRLDVDLGVAATMSGKFNLLDIAQAELTFDLVDKTLKSLYQYATPTCSDKEPPEPPKSVTATPAGSFTSLRLTWQDGGDNVATAAYEIFREGVYAGRSSSTSFDDRGLLQGSPYCYKVVALDAAGNRSTASANTCSRTPVASSTTPQTPVNLTAVASSTTAIALTWAPIQSAQGNVRYLLQMDGRPIASTAGTTFDTLKLQPETRYCYRVATIDSLGNRSALSAEVCATTLPPASAAWVMYLGCLGFAPNIQKDIDLNLETSSSLDVADSAADYDGTPLTYHLLGSYEPVSGALTAQINWTFANSAQTRIDEFSANLAQADSGDVTMTQVQVTGCDGTIRFVRK